MQIFKKLTMIQEFTLSYGMTDTHCVTPHYRQIWMNKSHTFLKNTSTARIALYASSVCKIW